jgi:hypothetical protein
MSQPTVEPWWSVVLQATSVTTMPVLQVAADGRWETAQVIPMAGELPYARTAVEHVARAAKNNVGVEIMWPAQAFAGVCWPAGLWREAVAAIGRTYVVMSDPNPMPQIHAVEAGLLALLGGTPRTDLGSPSSAR